MTYPMKKGKPSQDFLKCLHAHPRSSFGISPQAIGRHAGGFVPHQQRSLSFTKLSKICFIFQDPLIRGYFVVPSLHSFFPFQIYPSNF